MKFKLKTDGYREFRGYVFAYGKPTEVRDRGTVEALTGHPDFDQVPDEPVNGAHRETLGLPKRRGRPPKSEAVL